MGYSSIVLATTKVVCRGRSTSSRRGSDCRSDDSLPGDHEAEGLRQLSVDPMIVHRPAATRAESLEEFIRRVAAEPEITPGSAMQAHDCFVAGNGAILRWSYTHPNPTTERPNPIVGLTLYLPRRNDRRTVAGRVTPRYWVVMA